MKRAFDDNVSKAKPRLRLSRSFTGTEVLEPGEEAPLAPPPPREPPVADVALAAPEPSPPQATSTEQFAHAIAERVALEDLRLEALDRAPAPAAAAEVVEPPEVEVALAAPAAAVDTRAPELAPAPKATSRVAGVAKTPEKTAEKTMDPSPPRRAAQAAPAAQMAPQIARPAVEAPVAVAPAETISLRRERLKERLKRASQPLAAREPTPASSSEAEAASLAIIGQLQQALEASESRAAALERDLESSRSQLSRAAAEAREHQAQAQSLTVEAGDRTRLLEDLTAELAALEAERDDSLLQLSEMRAERDAEGARRRELEVAIAAKDKELLEALSEEERFAADLEQRTDEVRSLRTLAASLTTERDSLLQQLTQLNRDHEELGEARKALESVHRALSDARTRSVARR